MSKVNIMRGKIEINKKKIIEKPSITTKKKNSNNTSVVIVSIEKSRSILR